MVVFTCNHCGESLQKPRVEKHYQTTTCSRKPVAVSCMDCFKDFKLEEYVSHTKCITEDERYSAKGTVHGVKKGEAKQSSWVQTVNAIIEQQQNAKASVKRLLEMISNYDNIPRKKVKFINFVNSSSGGRIAPNDMEEVWGLLEAHKNATKAETEQKPEQKKRKSDEDAAAGTASEETGPKKKKKKDKAGETADTVVTAEGEGNKSSKKKKRTATDAVTEEQSESKEAEAVTNGEQPKKKKKKNKTTEETATEAAAMNGSGEGGDTAAEEQSKKKKKNKNNPEQNGTEESAPNVPATANETTEEKPKKKKKNKGTSESEETAKVEVTPGTNGTEESGEKKKKSEAKGLANGVIDNGESHPESTKQNGNMDTDKQAKKKKNKKDAAVENGVAESQGKDDGEEFCWRTAILEEAKKKSKGIKTEKLRAKVFERYEAAKGKIHGVTKMTKQYNKKIKKLANIKIEFNIATFVE